jgi:3-oxoacyl-[acyl-carrier protein] reductase
MELQLADRVFVLTGASRGLGRATAEVLVAEGARVVVSARDASSVDAAVAALGERATGVVADLADSSTPDRLITEATGRWGRFDGALVSTGGPPPGKVVDVSDDDWNKAFQSVFLGAVRMARTATAALGDGGSVALVLSRSVKEPLDDLAISNGLRPGLGMVVKALAREVGPRGVRVNGLLPGAVDTERMQQLHASAADPVAARRAAEEGIPLRRYGRPEEFGRIAAFVLSPAASYLTGAMIPVDGGVTHAL